MSRGLDIFSGILVGFIGGGVFIILARDRMEAAPPAPRKKRPSSAPSKQTKLCEKVLAPRSKFDKRTLEREYKGKDSPAKWFPDGAKEVILGCLRKNVVERKSGNIECIPDYQPQKLIKSVDAGAKCPVGYRDREPFSD